MNPPPGSPDISSDQVRKVASLARLAIPADMVEPYRVELAAVLGCVNRLRELDLDKVEPLSSPLEAVNRLAEDTPGPTLSNAQFMTIAATSPPGAPVQSAAEPPFISVPKVLAAGESA